jgi:3-oxoacyl-[acyl-carrier-protein] synthase II
MGVEPFWSALCEGRSAVKPLARFDARGFACSAGVEVPDELFDVKSVVPKSYRKATKVMARDIELAVGAAAAAVGDAGIVTRGVNPDAPPTIPPERVGCHIGAGLIAAEEDELTAALASSRREDGGFDITAWGSTGMTNLTPLWLLKYLPNMLACHVTIIHDCQGPSNTITCAEASSGLSIGESMRVIGRGDADACLSGGAESKLNLMGYLRQQFAGRLAPDVAGEPFEARVKPFDGRAAGTVLGEGGGILVLEAHETAAARGARVHAELLGVGASQGFCPDTVGLELDLENSGIADAVLSALEDAEVKPGDIDAIAPLGSGVPGLDRAETAGLARVFGARLTEIPLITITPNVGICGAGAGALQMIAAARALSSQRLPARLNATVTPGVRGATEGSHEAALRKVLVVTTGMGGQNVAAVLGSAS